MARDFPWYEVIENSNSLEQGDILENWIVNMPHPNSGEVVEEYYTLILMTQTCDIEDGIEGKAVNTEKHLSLFKADLNSLIILTKQGRTRVAPPVVKGEFL